MAKPSVLIPNVGVEYTIEDDAPGKIPFIMVTSRGNDDGTATFEVFAQNMGDADTLVSVLNVLSTTLRERETDG